jgi:hypothetical protein
MKQVDCLIAEKILFSYFLERIVMSRPRNVRRKNAFARSTQRSSQSQKSNLQSIN